MLHQRFAEDLSSHLQSRTAFRPVPTIEDRAAWQGLPATVLAAHIGRGEEALGYVWPGVPATSYLEFSRMGNRSRYEALHFDRRHALETLTLAECMEAEERFLDDIVNGIWAICEESSWCLCWSDRQNRAPSRSSRGAAGPRVQWHGCGPPEHPPSPLPPRRWDPPAG